MINQHLFNAILIPRLISIKFFEILMDLWCLSETKLSQTIYDLVVEKEQKLQERKKKIEKELKMLDDAVKQ